MNNTWITSISRMRRWVLVLSEALAIALIAAGCNLSVSPSGVEAITPSAHVSVVPGNFCIGEILTVTYDGGPQVSSCGSVPDSGECKGASLAASPTEPALTFPFGYAEGNLHGSLSAPADVLDTYTFTYAVEWEGWSAYREYRSPGRTGSGRAWTGRVQATSRASPLRTEVGANYIQRLVCDEASGTWRYETEAGTALYGYAPDGSVSACAAITQICINDRAVGFAWRLSVEGGPSVVLGGEGNPVCTDAFEGYHPDDIVLEVGEEGRYFAPSPDWGTRCTPGDVHPWRGTTILTFDLAGSTLCAVGATTGPGSYPSWRRSGIESFEFGGIELLGTARSRCEAALDPLFLAAYRALPSASEPIVIGDDDGSGIVTICDLQTTCGNSACETGCENAYTCSQDCQPSELNCPPGTYYAPVTNRCIQIEITEPQIENGDEGGGNSCPAGQSWVCNATKFPPICGCQ